MNRITIVAMTLGLGFVAALPARAQDVHGHADFFAPKDPPDFDPGPIRPPANFPPDQIRDLADAGSGVASVSLAWSAPSDPDGFSGTVAAYDVRISTVDPLTFGSDDEWYADAKSADGAPGPSTPGTTDSMTISGLAEGTTYYVAVTSTDGSGWSGVSNVVKVISLSTPEAPDDGGLLPPSPVEKAGGSTSTRCGNASSGIPGLALVALVALAATRGGSAR